MWLLSFKQVRIALFQIAYFHLQLSGFLSFGATDAGKTVQAVQTIEMKQSQRQISALFIRHEWKTTPNIV